MDAIFHFHGRMCLPCTSSILFHASIRLIYQKLNERNCRYEARNNEGQRNSTDGHYSNLATSSTFVLIRGCLKAQVKPVVLYFRKPGRV